MGIVGKVWNWAEEHPIVSVLGFYSVLVAGGYIARNHHEEKTKIVSYHQQVMPTDADTYNSFFYIDENGRRNTVKTVPNEGEAYSEELQYKITYRDYSFTDSGIFFLERNAEITEVIMLPKSIDTLVKNEESEN